MQNKKATGQKLNKNKLPDDSSERISEKNRQYGERTNDVECSLHDFWNKKEAAKRPKTKLSPEEEGLLMKPAKHKDVIMHHIGYNTTPIYPPTSGYAKSVLVLHKPLSFANKLDCEIGTY